jgi:hypothetical protein
MSTLSSTIPVRSGSKRKNETATWSYWGKPGLEVELKVVRTAAVHVYFTTMEGYIALEGSVAVFYINKAKRQLAANSPQERLPGTTYPIKR